METIEHLKNEFEVTKFAKADRKELAKMTKKLLKDYSSNPKVRKEAAHMITRKRQKLFNE